MGGAGARDLAEVVGWALAEDLGEGDVTSAATVPDAARARATITQKQPGVIFGLEPALLAFRTAGWDGHGRAGGARGAVA